MNAIKRAAEFLKRLTDHPRRLTGNARTLQLTKRTAHRFLETLEKAAPIKKKSLSGPCQPRPLMSQAATSPISEQQFLIIRSIQEKGNLRDFCGGTVHLKSSPRPGGFIWKKFSVKKRSQIFTEKDAMHHMQ